MLCRLRAGCWRAHACLLTTDRSARGPAALQEKQAEISELQTRLAAAADRCVALTEGSAQLDARLHEAQAAASRAALTQTRLEQEKEILEKSNAWLSQVGSGRGLGLGSMPFSIRDQHASSQHPHGRSRGLPACCPQHS